MDEPQVLLVLEFLADGECWRLALWYIGRTSAQGTALSHHCQYHGRPELLADNSFYFFLFFRRTFNPALEASRRFTTKRSMVDGHLQCFSGVLHSCGYRKVLTWHSPNPLFLFDLKRAI